MVEDAVKEAWANGYVIYNERTNSRRWFAPALSRKPLNGYEKSKVDGAARNCRIQGTQANMIIEAIVLIQRYIDLYNIPARLVLTVHDEVCYEYDECTGTGVPKYVHFPDIVKRAMVNTANKYLKNVKMDAEYNVGYSWMK